MNHFKLYEWLVENDCPFEWQTVDFQMPPTSGPVLFTDKGEEEVA